MLFAYYKHTIVSFHLIAFLVNEYFTPQLQKNVRDVRHNIVAAMLKACEPAE